MTDFINYIIAIAGDKGGIGKSLIAFLLARRTLDFEPLTCLIDCDDNQFTSKDFADDRIEAGIKPIIPVFNVATKNLEKELIELGKRYKIIFIEFGKAGKNEESHYRNEAMDLAIKLADLIICPVQPTPVDVRAFAKFSAKLPDIKVPAIIVPNRVKSANQLQALRDAAPQLKNFKISEAFLEDRLCYQETLGDGGKTIFDIKPSSQSEMRAAKESEQLFMELIYGA